MTTLAEFKKNFSGFDVPPELVKLLAFQDKHDFEGYSSGFGLLEDDKEGLTSWSEEDEFLSNLLPFAQASGSGSFYALWSGGGARSTSEMPVVVFGDEGGVHVVASDAKGLLRLLSYDADPMIDDDEVSYYKGDDHEPADAADEYKQWLEKEFGLAPVEDAEAFVLEAQKRHKAAFDEWMAGFVDRDDDEDEDDEDDEDE